MKINYTGNDIKPTESMQDYVEKRVEKLEKYFDGGIEIDVSFRKEGEMYGTQLALIAGKNRFRAINENQDLYTSIDQVVDTLDMQIKKQKEKQQDYRKDAVEKREMPNFDDLEFTPENEIIKYATFDLKPLTPEDAKLVLSEHKTNNFMVFVNSETNKTNVIFKLKDGKNYGLIGPDA